MASSGALHPLAGLLVEEVKRLEADSSLAEGGASSREGGPRGEEEEEEEEELPDAEGELMVGALVRILTACASRPGAATAICEAGAIPSLVGLLKRRNLQLQVRSVLG